MSLRAAGLLVTALLLQTVATTNVEDASASKQTTITLNAGNRYFFPKSEKSRENLALKNQIFISFYNIALN